MAEHVDVVVVGAGISGIGQGYHLQTQCPDRSYMILEAREAIGGTWDLFRYPGIRSDSDMHTLGFSFHPWPHERSIAGGSTIRDYVEDTARTYGIDRHIRFGHRVTSADWSSGEGHWRLAVTGSDGTAKTITCNFLCMCSGYYDYAKGYAPSFMGAEDFAGRIVHPQFWPSDLDYSGKDVVVIGSGATAVTLVPEMAKDAASVTMLQRSPTYVVSRPAEDAMANWLRRKLPRKTAYGLTRWKNVLLGMVFYKMARRRPEKTKERLVGMVREHLGPDYDVATHFTPRYNPWDQRLCLVPDADLFDAIKAGRASVVTGAIDRFVPGGIRLASGEEIAADVIVTATGLELQMLGGAAVSIDGVPVDLSQALQYKGMMFSDVPNMAFTFGYTNASWTLKADLVARYVCRLLNTMKKRGLSVATPHNADPSVTEEPFVDFSSGYIQRAAHFLPKQGSKKPWRLNQNYALDVLALRFGSVDDAMVFSRPADANQHAA
ncbi:cation diffusion facilitator CzcD-associated flavoprotein CzcO [Sphingomonas jinjuensis]|uniref:Cation diffusion facilitator CzcD-associated flavoprotein CzcO n=1 Tax=Sphingomonas jinjuensis TaxID=535907 RepID=A0A840FDA5_9SPHN|nr:NAD(P)/FAD-dependent oxidoreductase [Sphingomonas jinjuensis]MBB4153537.1 cation diffusion facilitator CzcD-associated flavoprotein CzcO [Sphingomonas jinjuensis]